MESMFERWSLNRRSSSDIVTLVLDAAALSCLWRRLHRLFRWLAILIKSKWCRIWLMVQRWGEAETNEAIPFRPGCKFFNASFPTWMFGLFWRWIKKMANANENLARFCRNNAHRLIINVGFWWAGQMLTGVMKTFIDQNFDQWKLLFLIPMNVCRLKKTGEVTI